jgi:hypothetical protein
MSQCDDASAAYVTPGWLTALIGKQVTCDARLAPLISAAESTGFASLIVKCLEKDRERLTRPPLCGRYETFFRNETDEERLILQAYDKLIVADAETLSLEELRDLIVLFQTIGLQHGVGEYAREFHIRFWCLPDDHARCSLLGVDGVKFSSPILKAAIERDTAWAFTEEQDKFLRGSRLPSAADDAHKATQ